MNIRNWVRNIFGHHDSPEVKGEAPRDLHHYFSRMARNDQVPGMAVGLEKQGKSLLCEGFGYADLEKKIPVDPLNHLFRAASISKPITSLGVMRMIDKGVLDLDAPIGTYLQELPADKAELTLRQLLSHTAGIRSYRGKEFALNKEISIQDGLELFLDDPLLFRPGTDYHYNSFDFVLVAAVMEAVGEKNFESLIRDLVLRPLGMESTRSEEAGNDGGSLVQFYSRSATGFRPATPVNNRYKLAGGGFVLTVGDILRLGQAVLDKALVPDALWEEFLTPLVINGKSTYYGLGWEVSRDEKGQAFVGHTGNSVGAHSLFRVYPDKEAIAAFLVNCSNPGVEEELKAISREI